MSTPSTASPNGPRLSAWTRFGPLLAVALAAGLAYSNTFRVPFVFDDVLAVFDNPTIGSLWKALKPPSGYGLTVSGRPVLNFSLALCHAISGAAPWSYHLLNLIVHTGAALALYGIAWRTLARIPWWMERAGAPRLFGLALALLWVLHPLQTESVTYVVQRAESLMGFFFLLSLYAFVRSVDAPGHRRWLLLAFFSCLLGVGTKEVIALAPVLTVFYDRAFLAGSFLEVWRRRRWSHLLLFATWIPLLVLIVGQGGDRGGTFSLNSWDLARTYWTAQLEAVSRYLRLSVVPWPQAFDYGFPVPIAPGMLVVYAAVVASAAGAALYALWRSPRLGFLGAWFFGILAPTSLVPGILQSTVEHRMYLPLAAVLAFVAATLVAALGRRALPVLAVAVFAAGVGTWLRNGVYSDDLTLWQDTVAIRPQSAIAQANVGTALYSRGRIAESLPYYRRSLELNAANPSTPYNLGLALAKLGRHAEALPFFDRTLELNRRFYLAHFRKGISLRELGRPADAYREFMLALETKSDFAESYEQIGALLVLQERWPDAARFCAEALQINPKLAGARANLGIALFRQGKLSEAETELRSALREAPALAEAHFNLGLVHAALGRQSDAIAEYAAAVQAKPDFVDALVNLGVAEAQAGRLPEALPHLEEAVRLAPPRADAQRNLASALFEAGRLDEAIAAYQASLASDPGHVATRLNLANALLAARRLPEAQRQFEEAAHLDPQQRQAADMAEKLKAYLQGR
ncbi:hypothetical protein DB347_00890 [Opitutaceae bacterium EW11]|nr:hypothetical protein DB347_00890 [Opitutaceae bacterium EW11]